MKSKELIALILSVIVAVTIIVPVIGATWSAIVHGEPVTRSEFLKTVGDLISVIVGGLLGYLLRDTIDPKP